MLLLDEPSTGMDPTARRRLWAALQTARHAGHTIVLTSHAMADADVLCTRVGILVNVCLPPIAIFLCICLPVIAYVHTCVLPYGCIARPMGLVHMCFVEVRKRKPLVATLLQRSATQCAPMHAAVPFPSTPSVSAPP